LGPLILSGLGSDTPRVISKMRIIEILEEPTELYKILKFGNMVESGGEAKFVILEGHVSVNGKVETRKRKKIFSGDVIEYGKVKIRIQLKLEGRSS
jgi:ribosome-associated protein